MVIDGRSIVEAYTKRLLLRDFSNSPPTGGLAEGEQIHGKKKAQVCLDINWPSEKRVKTGDAGGDRAGDRRC